MFTSKMKSGRLFIDLSMTEKRAKCTCAIIVHGHSLEIEVCKRNVRSGSRPHSRISRSEASFLFVFSFVFHQGRQEIGG